MNYNCTPRRLGSGRCLVLFSVLSLVLVIYVLNGSVWGISEPVVDVSIVHNTKINRLNNSSQNGVMYVNGQNMNSQNKLAKKVVTGPNSQKMNNLNNSGQQIVTDSNSEKMNSLINSSQQGVTDSNSEKMNSLINSSQQGVTDSNSQKMNSQNNSTQHGVADSNSQKMNSQNNSSQKRVTDVSSQKNNSTHLALRPPKPTDWYSQKMNRLKTLLQHGVSEDDPKLIQLIRTDFVFLPEAKPYNLKNPDVRDYSCGQSIAIDNVLSQKEKGFYIEAGAYDGESISNTLFFEKVRKWNGLLIEPDPFVFERLMSKNRKAILVNSCLNIKPQPSILEFNRGNEMGRVWVDQEDKNWVKEMKMKVNVIEVPCFSLYSILLAVNQTTIDYFSLDVEGRELSVLQSIPFDKLHIDTFTVEYLNGNDDNYYKDIKSFMEKNGYKHFQDLPGFGTCTARDSLFKKK